MISLFKDLTDWVVGFADSDWSALVLAVNSFVESVFFPVPPDALLIGISLRQPEMSLWLAALATVSSVSGAVVGYWLGRRVGRPLLYRLVPQSKVVAVERMFQRHGTWAVLVAAITPIPYKVFTITAGILELDMRSFIIASLIGRGVRFFTLGGLLYVYGDSIEDFIGENFDIITVGTAAALLVALAILFVVVRRGRARNVVS